MGSLFVKSKDIKIDGFLGKDINVPFYLQFVPGYVVDVVTSNKSLKYGNNIRNINSILALPHITDELFARRATASEENRYYPLLRGIVDVPAKGDPVLLCTIGKIKYYLGPLNVLNSPNWNDDNLHVSEYVYGPPEDSVTERVRRGESQNFKKSKHKRLIKLYKDKLDHPADSPAAKGLGTEDRDYHEIHGDLMLEGRHGNSIRIGSRDENPYLFISNGRNSSNYLEGTKDGSLISITQSGSIHQHFSGDMGVKEGELVPDLFMLGSDRRDLPSGPSKRAMSDLVSFVNDDRDPQKLIYEYSSNQILQTSDRIIINSRKDNIFLSSFNNIHIGSGNNLTISINNDLIIESKNIYLGKDAKVADEKEPMVLGQQLLNVLNDLITCLSTAHFISPAGAPLPLVDYSGFVPIAESGGLTKDGKNRKSLKSIQGELNSILSSYHFIEKNGQSNK